MIRVFARKTKWSPTDDLAFFDGPPLGKLPDMPVYISCTFTWDIPRAFELYEAWEFHCRKSCCRVRLGGPAFNDPGETFTAGLFVKEGVTFTSRGCAKKCPGCLVPMREGGLREINIVPGHIVQDNNLLGCSRHHVERVFQMLLGQKSVQFKGGLDIDYLEDWHVEWFKKMRLKALWVACDCEAEVRKLDKAADLLADFSIEKKHCYVLVGANGETQLEAQKRCQAVLAKGFLPFAQLYRGLSSGPSRGEWCDFCHYWSQPRLYRKTQACLPAGRARAEAD